MFFNKKKEEAKKIKKAPVKRATLNEWPVEKAIKLVVKKLTDNAVIPEYATDGSAAFDLVTTETVTVEPNSRVHILPTGLAFAIPKGFYGLVAVRSSVGFKHNCILPNGVGVIDSDYRGEVKIGLVNQGFKNQTFKAGTRVAQMLILPCPNVKIVETTDELDETERGEGGFGSTGKN